MQHCRLTPLALDTTFANITVCRPHSIFALLSCLDQLASELEQLQVWHTLLQTPAACRLVHEPP